MKPQTEKEVIDLLTTITSRNVGGIPMWIYHNATALLKSIASDREESKILNERNSVDEGEKSFVYQNRKCNHCGEDELDFDNGKLRCLCCGGFVE